MNAKLITLCGCSREFSTTWPPAPRIHIPINGIEIDRGWLGIAPTDPTSPLPQHIRVFELDSKTHPHSPRDTAYYVEKGT